LREAAALAAPAAGLFRQPDYAPPNPFRMSEPELSRTVRLEPKGLNLLAQTLSVLLVLGAICWAADLYREVGIVVYTEQYLASMLALALPLTYMIVPAAGANRRQGPVPWYDLAAALTGFVCAVYTAIRFPALTELTTLRPTDGIVIAAIMLVLLLEGLRRSVGKVLTGVAVCFMLFALVGDKIPGMLQGRPVELEKLVYYLYWDTSGVPGTPMRIITTIVVTFVLFGQVLFKSGGSAFFTDVAMALMGRYRGGPAKISVFASSLFGSISGSVVSNVVTTGVITIPLMKKGGYRPELAGAIEAVASTGGQLMPPVMGAAAFLMAEFLSVPYTEVVIAAIVPSLLYYAALFIEADLEAARHGIKRVDESLIPRLWPVLKAGWFFPLPFAGLVYALFWLNYLPEEAGLVAIIIVVVASIAFGFKGKRMGPRELFDSLRATGFDVIDIFMIGAAAGIVIGVLHLSGLGFGLTLALVQVASGSLLGLLVLAAVVCVVLGMGMPTVGVYVLLATLVAPALVEVGIHPMAAHMFIMYFGMMSMITPPVCIGAFAAASLAGADPMRTGFAAMRFGWIAFVIPFMFVASPTLLMDGEPLRVAADFVAALAGAWLGCIGIVGYFVRPLDPYSRVLVTAAGLCMVTPASGFGFGYGGAINLTGLILGAVLVGREVIIAKRSVPRNPR